MLTRPIQMPPSLGGLIKRRHCTLSYCPGSRITRFTSSISPSPKAEMLLQWVLDPLAARRKTFAFATFIVGPAHWAESATVLSLLGKSVNRWESRRMSEERGQDIQHCFTPDRSAEGSPICPAFITLLVLSRYNLLIGLRSFIGTLNEVGAAQHTITDLF